MTEKYIEPNIKSNYFTCPHCNKISTIIDIINKKIIEISNDSLIKLESNNSENYEVYEVFIFQKCANCYRLIIWSKISKNNIKVVPYRIESETKMIHPKFSSSPLPNEDILDDYLIIYKEAGLIFEDSPKAAAALLRTILEKFLRNKFDLPNEYLGNILKKEEVKKELGKNITNFLKNLKNIGNEGAHSSRMIYKSDDKKDVIKLFEGINLVFHRLITQEKIINQFE